jgi:hypothetical protein
MRGRSILRRTLEMTNGIRPRLGVDAALCKIAMTLFDARLTRTRRNLGRLVVLVREQRRVELWIVCDRTGDPYSRACLRRPVEPIARDVSFRHDYRCQDLVGSATTPWPRLQ